MARRPDRALEDDLWAAAGADRFVCTRRARGCARAFFAERAVNAPVLRIEGLRKRFGGLLVTDDVTLAIEAGELHAVIGPNGAGKTTLINQVSGLLRSDAGRIELGGRDVTALPMHA